MTAISHPATVPAARGRRPGAGTVYRWELRKLLAQKRTFLGLGGALAVPVIFVIGLLADSSGGGPDGLAFGSFVRETGLAVPLVCLTFGAFWLIPLITALVAGDIVATEDQNGTLKTILTRSVERWHVFAGKVLAAFTYAVAGPGALRRLRAAARRAGVRLRPGDAAVGHARGHGPRDRADRRRHAGLPAAGDSRSRRSRCCCRRSRATRPPPWSAR